LDKEETVMHLRSKVLRIAMAAGLILGGFVGISTAAQAAGSEPYIRMMDWNRYDILMESKTHAIATDPAQAAWACKEVIGGSAVIGGAAGAIAGSATCVSAITVCAAQATTAGKWGGMTFTILPPNFWCWKY
jgi:hypothetical protein